jgi:hypothetical protein
MADPELRFCFGLADRLHKTLDEITAMPATELAGWKAYLTLLNRESQS